MPAPASLDEFLELVRKSGVVDDKRLEAQLKKLRDSGELPDSTVKLAAALVEAGLLTNFQAEQLVQGKWRRFTIGKYRVLERLGSGGMGSVFLCEHIYMRRRVAVKVLPTAKASDPSSLERFYREARAVAAVDHPNIVHAYDIDQDENLHFIVMEYVDGPSLQEVVRRSGPVSLERACHYILQAAEGLEHASAAGLVHRDVKPGNILVDRTGVVKVLDLGLARFFNDDDDLLTKKYDENVLGTADYLAPEQADDSHAVDVRADIYSLGGTFYFLLTGRTPFGEGSVPQKLMWHRIRQPKPIGFYRGDVPMEVQEIIDKMMAKEPVNRFQTPKEVVAALEPWTKNPIPPPPENEMPRLSPAVTGPNSATYPSTPSQGPGSGVIKKPWHVPGEPPSPKTPSSGVGTGSSGSFVAASAAKKAPAVPASPRSTPQPVGGAKSRKALTPQPLNRPSLRRQIDEETAPWAAVAPDTVEASARGDTPPLVHTRRRPVKKQVALLGRIKEQQSILLFGGVTLFILGLVSLVAIILLGR
jgi:serine/threonine protein kinase